MNKKKVEAFAEKEIRDGKSHQEIFNDIVTTSDFNIHDVANVIRRIPTMEKRKKYAPTNMALVSVLGLAILVKLYVLFPVSPQDDLFLVNLLSCIIPCILLYGIYNYKRNAHLATGFVMTASALAVAGKSINHFDLIVFGDIAATLSGACMAFYLSIKLISDYKLDRELQKTHPEQRENSLIFIDK